MSFEEAFRVIKLSDTHYRGAHPLHLPLKGARGAYGGHICAQTLLVAIESAPDYLVHSLHSHFISPPNDVLVCHYEVVTLYQLDNSAKRLIKLKQYNKQTDTYKIKYTCIVSFVRRGGLKKLDGPKFQVPVPELHKKYPDPDKLNVIHHTSFVKNAYSRELIDFKECPEEDKIPFSERWITMWASLNNQENSFDLFKDPRYNYVGLGCISDSCIITTLARILHLPWNPTELLEEEEFDETKDAISLMGTSMNIIHLFHYLAMSLDHHIYFHCDNENAFDVVKDWLTYSYQAKALSNGRVLVRGGLFNPEGILVATMVQEGLAIFHKNIAEKL